MSGTEGPPTDRLPALSRREAFEDWGRGLGRLLFDLVGIEDPEAGLQRELARIPQLSDEELQELLQNSVGLFQRDPRLYLAVAHENLDRLQKQQGERLNRLQEEWSRKWGPNS